MSVALRPIRIRRISFIPFEEKNVKHRGSILASHPAAPGLILSIPKNFSLDVA